MARTVIGYHGTLLEQAELMMSGVFSPPSKPRASRWLGAGLYFFEENRELAEYYGMQRAMAAEKPGAVLEAEIDLSSCLDLTRRPLQEIVRSAHNIMELEGRVGGASGLSQKPFEIYKGQVRAGFFGDWKGYGANSLDYQVIERAVILAKEQGNLTFDTVRGIFLEFGPIYRSSWFYTGAHASISVREPAKRVKPLSIIPLR